MVKHPTIKWAESEDALFVTFEVSDCADSKINITEEGIEFSGSVGSADNKYACNLVLKGKVDPKNEETKINVTGRDIQMHIVKAEEGRWNGLLKDRKLGKNLVKPDFDKWIDSDDEEKDAGGFDTSQMGGAGGMPGMGGMGGMPGMGGMGGMPGMGGMGGMPGMGGMGGMPGMGGMGGPGGMDMAALQEMMKNMPKGGEGGMGGMPGMGGDEDGDEDDDEDDLPDLEDEDEAAQK